MIKVHMESRNWVPSTVDIEYHNSQQKISQQNFVRMHRKACIPIRSGAKYVDTPTAYVPLFSQNSEVFLVHMESMRNVKNCGSLNKNLLRTVERRREVSWKCLTLTQDQDRHQGVIFFWEHHGVGACIVLVHCLCLSALSTKILSKFSMGHVFKADFRGTQPA